ncbi:MAG: SulP family inorganic anion transporter [Candidatus Obscuribacterales bacterium]|nr:SulP family inorganic anion transporter [Candidatus Obscuribacterales bacterium]
MTNSMTTAVTAGTEKKKRPVGFDWPFLWSEWKDMFNPKTATADVWAGVTVALVALPLNLALAIAAGVEPGVGITTGIIAGVIGSLFGGQRYAVTGPAAAMAVVLIGIAQTYGIGAIWMVGIMAGMMQLVSGSLRLGKLISFIPMPVITGFANAIGVLVIFNSLDDFLGLPTKPIAHAGQAAPFHGHPFVPEFIQDIISLFWNVFVHHQWNWQAICIGSLVLGLAVLTPKLTKVVPGQLVAIVVASIVAAMCAFEVPRIIDISSIPTTVPLPKFPSLPWEQFDTLFPSAITVFMLGSIESLLSASVADGMTMSRRHHSDQELIGQGLANVVSPFFGGIPVTGVIARTAVNIRAGARTRLSGVVHSIVLMLLSFALAKQAEQIPLAALGGILILTGIRLVEWEATKQIFRASRTEGMIVLLTTAFSVLMDLTAGVVVGLILTCGLFIKQMSVVKVVEQEYDPADRRAVVRQPVPSCKYVRTFLVDGPLFFGAAERFTETILLTQNLKTVILHMKAVSVMDLTGAETILSIHAQLKRNGVRLILAELPHQPLDLLKRLKALEKIGTENLFKDFKDSILSANQQLMQTSCHGCASILNKQDGDEASCAVEPGPKDCRLRSAMAQNTDQIANIMRMRMSGGPEKGSLATLATPVADQNRLVGIERIEDIPGSIRGTPFEDLLACQNFFDPDAKTSGTEMIIGLCTDYRAQGHLPKTCTFVVRSPGANMQDSEFSIALAISSGVKFMALVVHNRCVMSNPFERRERFVTMLQEEHAWSAEKAETFFEQKAGALEIEDPIDFAISEASRLRTLFPSLRVVPLFYNVDNDKMYVIKDWLLEQEFDAVSARLLGVPVSSIPESAASTTGTTAGGEE